MLRIKGKLNSLTGASYVGSISCGSFVLLLATFFLIPTFIKPEVAATDVSTTTPRSSISTPTASISLPSSINFADVIPTPDGATTTASTSFSVATTESDGYSLYLYSEGDNSLKSSNPANISTIKATAGDVGLTLSSLKPNTWGYNLSTTAPDESTLYTAVPTDNSAPVQTQDTSITGQANDTYTLALAANVDSSIPSGAYSNTLTVAVVAEPQIFIADELPAGINEDLYTAENPGVVDVYPTTGWGGDVIAITSDGQFNNVTSVTIGGSNCEPHQVVSEYLIACKLPDKPASTDNGYAVAVTTTTGEIDMHNFTVRYFNPTTTVSMQDFTPSACGAMSVGDIVPLVDEQNNQVYRVKKMQDGKCWMIDNLKYIGEAHTNLTNVDGTSGLTYNNTDGRYNTVDGTSTQSTANSDKAFYNTPMFSDYCSSSDIQAAYTKCGYLYNWYAATAGTGVYGSDAYFDAPGSICPVGWRLPTAGSYVIEDFTVLNASMDAGSLAYGSTASYGAGWQFDGAWSGAFAGRYDNGTFNFQGTNGFYWSSTTYSANRARTASFDSLDVNPGNNYGNIYNGLAVRCVMSGTVAIIFDDNGADDGKMGLQGIGVGQSDRLNTNQFTRTGYQFVGWNTAANGSGTSYVDGANYSVSDNPGSYWVTLYAQWGPSIQDFTNAQCQSLASNNNYTVYDERDGSDYTVRYINGACWMTQNLRLAGGQTLTSEDSNIVGNWEFPNNSLTLGDIYTEARSIISDNSDPDTVLEYGGYYNYCAASAGTVCNNSTEQDALQDICPKGWRLPTNSEQSGVASYASAFSPTLSGYYANGSLYANGSGSRWWSATAYNSNSQYSLYSYRGSLGTNTDFNKGYGFSVRCIRSS